MADTKASALTAVATPAPATDVLYVAQAGSSLKATPSQYIGNLIMDATDTHSWRRGNNPQTWDLFQSYTDSNNYSAFQFVMGGGYLIIQPIAAGSGTKPDLVLRANTTVLIQSSGGSNWIQITSGLTTFSTSLSLSDGVNVSFGTTTGTQIGTATTQKLSLYGATPVVQRSGAAQAAVATTGSTQVTPFGYTTAAQADGIVTLLNELRAALVALGALKGAA